MSNRNRIVNLTRGYTCKFSQARRAVENCAACWVEYGISIRDLTLKEATAARIKQAKDREPMPFAEVPGLRFDPPAGFEKTHIYGKRLAFEAGRFAATGEMAA